LIFTETKLPGAVLVELEPARDERGFFARSYCEREFRERGLATRFPQCNVSFNHARGTLRGMHYQLEPHAEVKLVRCTAGAIFDVIVDLRAGSPMRLQWTGVELSARNRSALYIPEGFAHGFLTLEDATEVFYQMGAFHEPGAARGLRWDDPTLAIDWPAAPAVISARDASYPDLDPDQLGLQA
jgi:dTDP-4-dehydrorhamnose 3,5-epimerase